MNIENQKERGWGFRGSTIRALFSKQEMPETRKLIAKLRNLLSNAGEYGCFSSADHVNNYQSTNKENYKNDNI